MNYINKFINRVLNKPNSFLEKMLLRYLVNIHYIAIKHNKNGCIYRIYVFRNKDLIAHIFNMEGRQYCIVHQNFHYSFYQIFGPFTSKDNTYDLVDDFERIFSKKIYEDLNKSYLPKNNPKVCGSGVIRPYKPFVTRLSTSRGVTLMNDFFTDNDEVTLDRIN